MHVLALDTTTRDGSVALVDERGTIDERRGDAARTHAERLPRELVDVAAAHGMAPREVDLFAVATGPGSFTGLRIGIATIQGLAFTAERRVVGVSALEALAVIARQGLRPGDTIAAWMDARRREVFAALYRAAEHDAVVEIDPPTVGYPGDVLGRWSGRLEPRTRFAGDGASLYADTIVAAVPAAEIIGHPLLAGVIGRLALARRGDGVDPAGVRPLYVRRPDAEIERDRRQQTPATTDTTDTKQIP